MSIGTQREYQDYFFEHNHFNGTNKKHFTLSFIFHFKFVQKNEVSFSFEYDFEFQISNIWYSWYIQYHWSLTKKLKKKC